AARMRQRTGGAVAFVLDSETGTRGAPSARCEERLRMLREAGGSALAVPPGASLTDLWRDADRHRASTGAESGPAVTGWGS
ncbi:DUF58 domain-containing protein, partial [Streptomyces sp. A475]